MGAGRLGQARAREKAGGRPGEGADRGRDGAAAARAGERGAGIGGVRLGVGLVQFSSFPPKRESSVLSCHYSLWLRGFVRIKSSRTKDRKSTRLNSSH